MQRRASEGSCREKTTNRRRKRTEKRGKSQKKREDGKNERKMNERIKIRRGAEIAEGGDEGGGVSAVEGVALGVGG